jgi:HAD superfamily hydrolase (TIGR01548 family)
VSYAPVRAVIFDIDGVLLDARPSYHAVAEEAARRAVATVVGEEAARAAPFDLEREVAQFKAAGGFNDDWEMSRAIALLLLLRARGRAPSLGEFLAASQGRGTAGLYAAFGNEPVTESFAHQSIARSCGALYGGKSHCKQLFGIDPPAWAPERGFWERELLLADATLLQQVAARFPLALFTGRNPGEAALALLRVGLAIPEARRWVADGRPRKPEPQGLVELCDDLLGHPPAGSALVALFLGDTADDRRAAAGAQARGAPLLYAHVEREGDTARALAKLLAETEAR